jgi:transglutaminase-like putative cysteine protease
MTSKDYPPMLLSVGCEFTYTSPFPTPAVALVRPREDPAHRIVREEWRIAPETSHHEYHDLFGNRCERLTIPEGETSIIYDAVVEISGEPDEEDPAASASLIADLPDDLLVYTLSSRYCPSETMAATTWRLFGHVPPGWGQVQAICDWIHANIQYGSLHSTPSTTALDVYVASGGMCRDFAHLAITFCRALNIPARYVFGYMPDIGVPGPFPPMDFHAWFEVWLDGRWWTRDARFNMPRIGRIPIGVGRDAVDVAMMTTYGPAQFQRMVVWTDEVDSATPPHETDHSARGTHLQQSEGLRIGAESGHPGRVR